MISQVLLGALALAAPGNLPAARNAYSNCLAGFTRAQAKQGVDEAGFQANLATACKAEEANFRSTLIATDVAAKIARAAAERNANEEIGYIHDNAVETFKLSLPAPPK